MSREGIKILVVLRLIVNVIYWLIFLFYVVAYSLLLTALIALLVVYALSILGVEDRVLLWVITGGIFVVVLYRTIKKEAREYFRHGETDAEADHKDENWDDDIDESELIIFLDALEYYRPIIEILEANNKQIDTNELSSRRKADDLLRQEFAPLLFSKLNEYVKNSIILLRANSWQEFEKAVAFFLKANGFKVYLTKHGGDFGADVIAEKGNRKICIQCKYWKKPVGVRAVQEINTAKGFYGCSEAWVVTSNNKFSKQAIKLAAEVDVNLYNVADLIREIGVTKTPSNTVGNLEKEIWAMLGAAEWVRWIDLPNSEDMFSVVDHIMLYYCPLCLGKLQLKYIRKFGKEKYCCTRFPKCWYLRDQVDYLPTLAVKVYRWRHLE